VLLLARELLVSGWRAGQGMAPRVARGKAQECLQFKRPAAAALAHWLGPHWRRPAGGPSGLAGAVLALVLPGADSALATLQASKARQH